MSYDDMARSASVNFYIRYTLARFAHRRLFMVPRVGDLCVFNDVRYKVAVVEWCLDPDAANGPGLMVNVELVERREAGLG